MSHPQPVARHMYDLVEPIGLVAYFADESDEALMSLGLRNPWDTYFAARAAPFGETVPAEVVHAVFYNFAPGEVARHLPRVWDLTTPEAALAARERGCVAGMRRILGALADDPGVARAGDLLLRAATSAPVEGRALYAALACGSPSMTAVSCAGGEMVDVAELGRGQVERQGVEHVGLCPADALGQQSDGVAVAAVFAEQGGRVPEPGHGLPRYRACAPADSSGPTAGSPPPVGPRNNESRR